MQIVLTKHDVPRSSANPSRSERLLYIGLRSGTPIALIVARQERKEETQRSGGVKAKFTSRTRVHARVCAQHVRAAGSTTIRSALPECC